MHVAVSSLIWNEFSDSREFQMIENLWKCAIKMVGPANAANVVRLALCHAQLASIHLSSAEARDWFLCKGFKFNGTLIGHSHGSTRGQ